MGAWKQEQMRYEDQVAEGGRIAVDAGTLERCPVHSHMVWERTGFEEDRRSAYRLGNSRFSRGELDNDFSTRRELTDAIKAAIDDAGPCIGGCPHCD